MTLALLGLWLSSMILNTFLVPPTDSFYDTFHTIADVMYFCQMLAIMEVINPAVGLVKTGVMPAFIQVSTMLQYR